MASPQEKGLKKKKEGYQVQAVDRALRILSCFSLTNSELSLAEISEMTELPKPTVFRLLASLEAARFVETNKDNQLYTVGIRLFELGEIYQSNLSIERVLTPFMQEITQEFDIVCNLGILDDGQVVYIASTDQGGPFRHVPIIGYRHFVHCSALGKSLMIDLPDSEVIKILEKWGMPALSPHTITNPEDFLINLGQVRAAGYSVDDQEGAVGIYCLAVPIRQRNGDIAAALSASGPTPKFSDKFKDELLIELQSTADRVQKLL